MDLEAVEMAIRSAMHHAGAAVLAQLLEFDPPGPAALLLRSASEVPGLTQQAGADRRGRSALSTPLLLL